MGKSPLFADAPTNIDDTIRQFSEKKKKIRNGMRCEVSAELEKKIKYPTSTKKKKEQKKNWHSQQEAGHPSCPS